MSQVQQLYRLQQYDSEIDAKKRRLSEVIRLQHETEELRSARRRADAAQTEVTTWQTTQKDLNLELGGVNDKAKRSNQRLYSGKVTKPKELEDLQHEVEALGRRRAALEDEVLEAMIMLEDAQEESTAATASLEEIAGAWSAVQAELKAEQDELALALHGLIGQREAYKARLDPKAVANYEAIRGRANGLAVVKLVNNSCGGCHVTVSVNTALRAERGESVTCNGCGRLLYLP
ncbi:MAG: zinc ribbon domain-containing protein [Candidatus Promineifilaceae bacterium]